MVALADHAKEVANLRLATLFRLLGALLLPQLPLSLLLFFLLLLLLLLSLLLLLLLLCLLFGLFAAPTQRRPPTPKTKSLATVLAHTQD